MTTRTYYFPKSGITIHILNCIIEKVGCSIGELKINRAANVIRVPITCNDKDVPQIEKILKMYDVLDAE